MVMILIIFAINIVYVTFMTIRIILTLKGYRYIAAAVSMIETVVYVIGLGLVLDNLDQIQNLIAYALGYGIGVIIGSKIEERLALGYITVNVITADVDKEMPAVLRRLGYGVTDSSANGLSGNRSTMQILTPRKYEMQLYKTITELDPKAFIISYEPKSIHGGFWVKSVKRGKLFK
ncbi:MULTISPECIES: DUF2179 domain-containing protein [unclassified Sporosarcina]|uniref:DUF2179 domain-containing protein n=1 Tax=unclassified Sporosarcina TaxID=2647733 RepID=UPI000C16773F|nr:MULTISPECIES: DUF2179 domain-containing protein [unclassified Sporosarcina]PIC85747.1 DUF2179 domain-containing protein [Sporosarcina sp. P20a]PIC98681.1 DUF2179 domain-containing protein [Sporosarcina sp. P29]PID04611.1 DUF2179 domain-containing protein [Sporosarcina sp. P30]PID07753.1 DUF2179 domain-containing protein [Sporosarcina sp. P31]PID10951.1 DUF2179 domain-containing protein [Sporosarcina sp. P32b]